MVPIGRQRRPEGVASAPSPPPASTGDEIGVPIAGRHVFDITDGWDGTPPSGTDDVVVGAHRPAPQGWDSYVLFHFVHGIEAAVTMATRAGRHRTSRRCW